MFMRLLAMAFALDDQMAVSTHKRGAHA